MTALRINSNFTNNVTDNCTFYISDTSRAGLGSTLLFVFFVGGVGNCILSFLVIRHTEMHCTINILLSTMAVSDAIISIVCVPFDIASFIMNKWVFGEGICRAHSYLFTILVVQNVTLLVIISIDRYYILVHHKNYLFGFRTTSLIPGCLVFSIIVSSPPLLKFGNFMFVNEYCKRSYDLESNDIIYLTVFASLLFVLPCGLLLLAYVHIILTIRKTKHRVMPAFNRTRRHRQGFQSFETRFKQKTFVTILWLYVAAVACKLPLAVTLLVQLLNNTVECPHSQTLMTLTYLNSAVNPFIYASKITTYWMVLNGKFSRVKDHVRSLRMSRKRSKRESIYRISIATQSVSSSA